MQHSVKADRQVRHTAHCQSRQTGKTYSTLSKQADMKDTQHNVRVDRQVRNTVQHMSELTDRLDIQHTVRVDR